MFQGMRVAKFGARMAGENAALRPTAGKTLRLLLIAGVAFSGMDAASAVSPMPPLPSMSAKEERADKIWLMRAGLNVAALQCQFSPFLQTVPTYNALLRQHSDEMAESFKLMTGYFVKQNGPRVGQRAFDTYATRANQSWSTFDAQLKFCNAAAMAGRRALAVPKGHFGEFAETELENMRLSLTPPTLPESFHLRLEWPQVPTVTDPCQGKKRCK